MSVTNEVTARKDQAMRDNMDDAVEIRGLDAFCEARERLNQDPPLFEFEVRSSGLEHHVIARKTGSGWALIATDSTGHFIEQMSQNAWGGGLDSAAEVVLAALMNIGVDRRCAKGDAAEEAARAR